MESSWRREGGIYIYITCGPCGFLTQGLYLTPLNLASIRLSVGLSIRSSVRLSAKFPSSFFGLIFLTCFFCVTLSNMAGDESKHGGLAWSLRKSKQILSCPSEPQYAKIIMTLPK